MPTIRIGYGSDFSIDSNGVGIGTTFAAANTKSAKIVRPVVGLAARGAACARGLPLVSSRLQHSQPSSLDRLLRWRSAAKKIAS